MKCKVLLASTVALLALGTVCLTDTSVAKADVDGDNALLVSTKEYEMPQYSVPQKYQELDKYVSVENNKFVLRLPLDNGFSKQLIVDAKEQLDIANKAVEKNGLTIDPQTKAAVKIPKSTSPFIILAKLPANQNITYAWGVRSIFRSNAAVSTRVNIYYNVYYGAMAVGDVAMSPGMSGFPWYQLIGTVASSIVSDRTKTWADRLNSYNQKHKKSRIYQDINWALQDSEGIWHD